MTNSSADSKMKAIIWTKYGSPEVLELQQVKKPVPKDNEVLIRIFAATVTAGDCETRSFKIPVLLWLPMRLFMGILKPRIPVLGQELAGVVECVGKKVTHFKQGDPIFTTTEMNFGAYAEYVCLPETFAIATKPSNMTFEEAAAVPVAGLNALYFLRKAKIKPGQKVLVIGAGGSIGTFAVQLAKSYGAEVTAVDNAHKLDILRSIGASHAIDYTKQDFTQNGILYDVIFDIAGKTPVSRSLKSLKADGLFIANPTISLLFHRWRMSICSRKKVISGAAKYSKADLVYLRELIEAGKIKSVIDRIYPLEQIPEAHKYVETGQKTGNVVIAIGAIKY